MEHTLSDQLNNDITTNSIPTTTTTTTTTSTSPLQISSPTTPSNQEPDQLNSPTNLNSTSPTTTTTTTRSIPHRRVKLYRLKDDQWLDLGTGNCVGLFIDPASISNSTTSSTAPTPADEGAWIVVSKEGTDQLGKQPEVLLRSKVQSSASGYGSDDDDDDDALLDGDESGRVSDAGRYQRQQDTLIVWTDRQTEMEMALSFATTGGCAEIWDFIKQARRWNADQIATSPSVGSSLSSPQPFPLYGNQITRLPELSLSTITQVETAIRALGRTASGREATATAIIKGEMIQKLIRIQEEAEDLESIEDLHALCRVMQTILLLNDNVIFELVLRDELILGVASILEYDPEFPTMKASYRAHLADSSHFTQVVPIRSPATLVKIHQTHRLYYLKDVVLARILEDSTFSMLNSAIYFNEVDIVNEIAGDEQFLHELFSIFYKDVGGGLVEKKMHEEDEIGPHPPRSVETIGPQLPIDMQGDQQNGSVVSRHFETPLTSTSSMVITNGHSTQLTLSESLAAADALINRQHDAILFIQQFCSMAKNLQLPLRAAFFRNLVSKGLLRVIEVALAKTRSEGDSLMRSATVGILMNLVDHDPNNVRGYSLQQHSLEKRPLVVFLVELFNKEPDLGLKAQMAEALRVLVDAGGEGGPLEAPPRMRQEDPEAEKFLQYFYDHCILTLLSPILELPSPTPPDSLLDLSAHDVALCCHLCDLLCFFVTHHTFRSKYFVLSSPTSVHVAKLFKTRHKHLRLAALRYFRACIGKNDDFYNRFLIKNDLFRPILELALGERGKDNLLASACLEFFEYLRLNNTKAVLNHLMTAYGDRVRALAPGLETFSALISKWEQNNEPPPPPAEVPSVLATSKSMTRERGSWSRMDMDEESYFNESDDEDELVKTSTTSSGTRKRDDEDEGGRKRIRLSPSSSPSANSATTGVFVKSQLWNPILSEKEAGKISSSQKKGLVDYGNEEDSDEEGGGFIRETREDAPPISSSSSSSGPLSDDDQKGTGLSSLNQLPSIFDDSSNSSTSSSPPPASLLDDAISLTPSKTTTTSSETSTTTPPTPPSYSSPSSISLPPEPLPLPPSIISPPVAIPIPALEDMNSVASPVRVVTTTPDVPDQFTTLGTLRRLKEAEEEESEGSLFRGLLNKNKDKVKEMGGKEKGGGNKKAGGGGEKEGEGKKGEKIKISFATKLSNWGSSGKKEKDAAAAVGLTSSNSSSKDGDK